MKSIAIIPARGGSKRIKNKNIIPFGDEPLIAYSIHYSHNNDDVLDQVYVSTDSARIAEIAKKYGADVLDRPSELADDYTPTADVIKFHVNQLLNSGEKVEWISVLQPTNPFRPDWLFEMAFKKLKETKKKCLATFSPLREKFGVIEGNTFKPENYNFGERSQDLKERYYENGLLYISHVNLARQGILMTKDLYPLVVDTIHATVDIDNEQDLEYAKTVLNYFKKNSEDK